MHCFSSTTWVLEEDEEGGVVVVPSYIQTCLLDNTHFLKKKKRHTTTPAAEFAGFVVFVVFCLGDDTVEVMPLMRKRTKKKNSTIHSKEYKQLPEEMDLDDAAGAEEKEGGGIDD